MTRACAQTWSEEVERVALLADLQGLPDLQIIAGLREHLGFVVSFEAFRSHLSRLRRGWKRRGQAPRAPNRWKPPQGYQAEYRRLRATLGPDRAKREVMLVAERDAQRRAQAYAARGGAAA